MEDYFEVWWFGVNLDCNVKNSVVVKFLSIYIYIRASEGSNQLRSS